MKVSDGRQLLQNSKPLHLIFYPEVTDPAVNLALEEYCFRNLPAGKQLSSSLHQ